MTTTIFISIALLVVCWGIPNHDDVTNFLRAQVLCSALPGSHRWFVCAHLTAMCWKKEKKMERERYCELIWCLWIGLIFRNNVHLQPWVDWKIFTTQLAGTEFSRRRHRGRWRERGIVHWFGACELVWYLEIMCIFSHESIEKSLPHNLQEPNSRGDVNAEDGEVIVDSKSFSTQNAQVGYWLIGAQI